MARESEEFEGLLKGQVLEVLRLHDVDVAEIGATVYLSREEIHKALDLEDRVYRRMIKTLSRWFDIPIHHFYHPEMIPRDWKSGS